MTNVSVTRQVADQIRSLRAQRRWSARQLAEVCAGAGGTSLTRGTIAKIESGSRKYVTADELTVLAQAFDVSPSALLSAVPSAFEPAVPEGDAQDTQAASTSEADRTATAMRTLPRDTTSFTGRQSEFRLLRGKTNPGGVVGTCVIDGMAGVGKTAFAIHAAHQLS